MKRSLTRGCSPGFSLVESMMGIVLLAIMAVGTASMLYHNRAEVSIQRNKRVALEVAGGRLEAVRASHFNAVKPPANNYNRYYLSRVGSNWLHHASNPGETVNINGLVLPMTTIVQFRDVDGGGPSYDCLNLQVRVAYRMRGAEDIKLESIYAR